MGAVDRITKKGIQRHSGEFELKKARIGSTNQLYVSFHFSSKKCFIFSELNGSVILLCN